MYCSALATPTIYHDLDGDAFFFNNYYLDTTDDHMLLQCHGGSATPTIHASSINHYYDYTAVNIFC
jgi:hypothetical protein